MQLAEAQQTFLQVVDLGHSISNCTENDDSVLLDGSRSGAQVLPVGEVGLGLGVRHQQPVWVFRKKEKGVTIRGCDPKNTHTQTPGHMLKRSSVFTW